MQLKHNGITVQIEDAEVIKLALERLSAEPGRVVMPTAMILPKIGTPWPGQGGVYAGIARSIDGQRDYHLIVGPEYDGEVKWEPAVKWAAELEVEGHRDFALPRRKEQALCFANVPELFKPEGYWSCEHHASIISYAWCQDFSYGGQSFWHKVINLRARTVRSLIIQ